MGINGLNYQAVDVKFTKGLDTHDQPKLVVPGKWSQLENCSLSEDGTPIRRDGIVPIVATANGNGIAAHGTELLVINSNTVSSLTTAQTDAMVTKSGELGYVSVAKDEVYRSTALVDSMDTAWGNGFSCYVWREAVQPAIATGIRYTLIDETTGAKVFDAVLLANSSLSMCPRVVYSSDAFFILYIDGGTANPTLQCSVIRVSGTPTVGPLTALFTSASLGLKNFDACSCDLFGLGSPLAMVVYPWNDGVTSVRTIGVTHVVGVPSVSLGPTNAIAEATATYASLTAMTCALFTTGSIGATRAGIFAMGTGASPVVGRTIDTTWAVTAGPTTLSAVVVYAGASHITAMSDASANIHLFFDQRARQGVVGFLPVNTVAVDSGLVITAAETTLLNSASFDQNAARASGPMGPWIAGKAFRSGSSYFLPVCIQEDWGSQSLGALGANCVSYNEQCTFFLLNAVTGVVVAKALYGAYAPDAQMSPGAPIPATLTSTPGSVATIASGVFSVAMPERTRLQIAGTASGVLNVSQAGVVRIKLTPNTSVPPIKAQLGESTYFAGGQLTSYDGTQLTEEVFPLFPEGISAVVAAGGSMSPGAHRFTAVYEWVDGAGNLIQSAPAPSVSVTTTAANAQVSVIIPTLLLSQKPGIRIVVYATLMGGVTFYRVTPVFTPVVNITTATTLTYAVTAADASLSVNELLYCQPLVAGSTLANVAPGPCSALGVHQNRIFVDKTDTPGAFRYSQQLVDNVGIQWNDALGGQVDRAAGAIVGFATMDEKLIIFCARRPFVVYGSGPNGSGGFSGYGEPQEIPSDIGCSEARSILKMKDGIIFKSQKGWYLLGRDLQTRYIGEGVAAFDANSVSSAVVLEDRQECRFSSTSGTQLIYSYEIEGGQWSTTVYRSDSGAAVSNYLVADAMWWATGGYYATVSTTLGLNQDTPGVYLDKPGTSANNLAIITTERTAWLKMSIINGFQRVRKMFLTGTSPNAPTSTLTVTVQFNDAYGASIDPGSYSFTVAYGTMFPTFTVGTSVDFEHSMRTQKCKSVAFTFVDTPTTANPSGVNFQALSLELGLKRGLRKLPAAQTT